MLTELYTIDLFLQKQGSLPLNCFIAGHKPGVMVDACNFSTWEAEDRGLLQVDSQAVLYSEFATNLGHRVRPCLKNQQQ